MYTLDEHKYIPCKILSILAKKMNLQRFLQKNLFLARFLQTMSIFQESCKRCNSCRNLLKVLQETPSLPESSKIGIFVRSCTILSRMWNIMHYFYRILQDLTKIPILEDSGRLGVSFKTFKRFLQELHLLQDSWKIDIVCKNPARNKFFCKNL